MGHSVSHGFGHCVFTVNSRDFVVSSVSKHLKGFVVSSVSRHFGTFGMMLVVLDGASKLCCKDAQSPSFNLLLLLLN